MIRLKLDNLKLYNKYRPTSFDSVIGQDDAVTKLRSLVKSKAFSHHHSYIFHSALGGVGKTLLARIFAKAMNCSSPVNGDACGACENCLKFANNSYPDYHEYNAAEWNTVDKVNSIVDLAAHMPHNPAGIRVIVMDEFQRVSGAAQDNMLKVLEEAAFLNVFILCTTEFHNIKDTIRSRCFDMEMKSVPISDIVDLLVRVCNEEGLSYCRDDLESLAVFSRGCVREAVKKLEFCVEPGSGVVNVKMLNYKYTLIFDMLLKAIKGDLKGIRDGLPNLEGVAYKEDMLSVLLDFQLAGIERPRVLPPHVVAKYSGYMKPYLSAIKDSCLKYNFDTENQFMLLLTMITDLDMFSSVKEIATGRGRRFSGKDMQVSVPDPAQVFTFESPSYGTVVIPAVERFQSKEDVAPVDQNTLTEEDVSMRLSRLGFRKVD